MTRVSFEPTAWQSSDSSSFTSPTTNMLRLTFLLSIADSGEIWRRCGGAIFLRLHSPCVRHMHYFGFQVSPVLFLLFYPFLFRRRDWLLDICIKTARQ